MDIDYFTYASFFFNQSYIVGHFLPPPPLFLLRDLCWLHFSLALKCWGSLDFCSPLTLAIAVIQELKLRHVCLDSHSYCQSAAHSPSSRPFNISAQISHKSLKLHVSKTECLIYPTPTQHPPSPLKNPPLGQCSLIPLPPAHSP